MNRNFTQGDIVRLVVLPPRSEFIQAVGMSGFVQKMNDSGTRACFMGLAPDASIACRSWWMPCSCLEFDTSIESRAMVTKYFVSLGGRAAMNEIWKAGPEFAVAVKDIEERLNTCMHDLNASSHLVSAVNQCILPRLVHLVALALQVRTTLPEEVFDSLIPSKEQP